MLKRIQQATYKRKCMTTNNSKNNLIWRTLKKLIRHYRAIRAYTPAYTVISDVIIYYIAVEFKR